MNRRQIIQLLGATALGAAYQNPARAAATNKNVVVIGAGIVGAAIAYRLASRGARVTVLEKTAPASGATGDSFAYLNASTKPERPYFELNVQGIAGWQRLQQELKGALPLQLNGAVYWRDEAATAEKLFATLRRVQEWGYAGHRLDEAQLRRLLPNAQLGAIAGAALYEQEGAVDPAGAVKVLLERAKALGAKVEFPLEVSSIDVVDGAIRAVRTSAGKIDTDAVVVAAGLGSQALLESVQVKLPLTSSVGVLAHLATRPKLLDNVVFAPGSTIKQKPDGRIVTSSGHEGSTEGADSQGARILQSAARYFPQLKDSKIERVSIGHRVLPADGFPIVGFPPNFANLYVAVTHSGVTLAPAIAQYAAEELLDGVVVEGLAPYRPARFAS